MLPCLFAESLKPCADAEVDGAIGPWTGWASAFADSLLSLLSTKNDDDDE